MGGFSDPEHPIFAPPIREKPRRSRRWLVTLPLMLLAAGCCGVAALASAHALLSSVRQALNNCTASCMLGAFGGGGASASGSSVPMGGASGGGAVVPPGGAAGRAAGSSPASAAAANGAAMGRMFGTPVSITMWTVIEQSWGIDSMAENARRLESIAQSLREYEQVHGHPPDSLQQLRLLSGDLNDVFGNPVGYRVVGQPPRWQLRSAGFDRVVDDLDPWLPER